MELAGLVVVDFGPSIDSASGESVASFISSRPRFGDLDEAEAYVHGVNSTARDAGGSGVAQNLGWTDEGFLSWKHDPTQFSNEVEQVAAPDQVRESARRIACPLVVLRGERSRVFTDEGAAELAGLVPGAYWERVPDAGHTIQASNPRAFAAAVERFLRSRQLVPTDDGGVS